MSKVGASTIKGSWSVPLPSYAKGTGSGVLKNELALVNDAKGSNYREMYRTPDGQVGMFPAMRNMIVPLKKGTEILDAENSARLASLMGLNHYASGIGSWFSDVVSGAKDVLSDATKIIAHPIEFLEGVFDKFTSSITSKVSLASDIISNFPVTIAKSAVKWVKSLFSDFTSGGSIPTADHEKLMAAAGIPSSWYSAINWIVNTESGWKTNAKNASSGAYGLPQSLPASKMASAGSDYLTNPVTQLKWMKSYISGRYGTAAKAMAFHKAKGWYANGGIVSTEGLYGLAEKNKPEMAIPLDSMKSSRAWELIGKAAAMVATSEDNSSSTSSSSNDSTSEVTQKMDKVTTQLNSMITLMGNLLNLNSSQLDAIKSSWNKSTVYKQMGTDQTIANYQTLGL